MSRKWFSPEQIRGKLREAEVTLAQGQTAAQVCRSLSIAEQTFYRRRREYGGLKVEQAKRLKALEQENARLRQAGSDLSLDKLIIQESDNGPEFTAKAVREWLSRVGVKPLHIEPGSPWENGYNESFNEKLRDELLNGEIFYTLKEAQILIERWRQEYNTIGPTVPLGYGPPAPEVIAVAPRDPGSAMLRQDLWADSTPTLT
jgi:putative transposase